MRVRAEDLVWQDLDEDMVVLDLRSSRYLRINESGAFLWRRLEDGASKEQLVEALTAEYDVDDETATSDVEALVAALDEHGLLIQD